VRGRFAAEVRLTGLQPPEAATLRGEVAGPLGVARGVGHIRLSEIPQGTCADYDYEISISGKVAAIGGRMLHGSARAVIELFFRRLSAAISGSPQRTWWHLLSFARTVGKS
jgi:2-furoyl-CoA dehydrogenase large subunit